MIYSYFETTIFNFQKRLVICQQIPTSITQSQKKFTNFPILNLLKVWAKPCTKTGTNDIFWDYNFQFHEIITEMSTNTHTDSTISGVISQFLSCSKIWEKKEQWCMSQFVTTQHGIQKLSQSYSTTTTIYHNHNLPTLPQLYSRGLTTIQQGTGVTTIQQGRALTKI